MPATRREFLAASALTLSAASYTRAADKPNEKVRLAVMGLRVRGKQLAPVFAAVPGVAITHLVDPDPAMVKPVLKGLQNSAEIVVETDIRKVLDDKSVTAVVVSAPDHWHALATVWAARREARLRREAGVAQPDRRPAHGRGGPQVQGRRPGRHAAAQPDDRDRRPRVRAEREAREGGVRAGLDRRRPAEHRAREAGAGAGGRRLRPVARAGVRRRSPRTASTTTGTGSGTWAPARSATTASTASTSPGTSSASTRPTKISCAGGKYFYDDDQQTPDTQIATFDFPTGPGGATGCTLLWEHRVWEKKGQGPEGQSYGIAIHGDKGTMLFDGDSWQVRGGDGAAEKPKGDMMGAHVRNFVESIRGDAKPNAEIEIGHTSTRLCHLGNIAYRTGKTLKFDAKTETTDDAAANKLLGREYRKGFELPAV